MKTRNEKWWFACLMVLIIGIMTSSLAVVMRQALIQNRQREVDHILHFYTENILLQLKGKLNEANTLAEMALAMKEEDPEWFEAAAASILEREEVLYAGLFVGDEMVSALPKDSYSSLVGSNLKDQSYIYTLAKVVKELVVEGPVTMVCDTGEQEVFLFLEPYIEDGAYLGEVAVALDSDYVIEQFGMDYLAKQGYDYELWRVDPQDGGKEVIAVSSGSVDFSHAAKAEFYLPTQWNLSVQPVNGWISPVFSAVIILICSAAAVLSWALIYFVYKKRSQDKVLQQAAMTDSRSGLPNREGFTAKLEQLIAEQVAAALFYFAFEDYSKIAQLIGIKKENEFLCDIPRRLQEFIHSPYIAGRLEAGNYAIAVMEDMDEGTMEDFAKGLSLELLLKIRLHGERGFLTARYQYIRCHKDNGSAEAQIDSLINAYYARLSKESPVQTMTEKCRQLIEGRSDVVFDEYTDLEMMELSKAFNQYRKQVEQLAYFDPVFIVGNRQKFLRDANMLISYDKKRQFSIFCVDICAFSQYNELFSADVGDHILKEVLNRLSRIFGNYLYRINGDVFLGISLSSEEEEQLAERIQKLLTMPACVGNASFALAVRVVICRYPAHGSSPYVLLDHVQSGIRYSKESNQKIVIYNSKLDEMIKVEADIRHKLKDSMEKHTLEVWYQPLMLLEKGRFTSMEALVRLPNDGGGYFSAGQVIALAERSSMAEEVGDYVLEQACRFMSEFGEELGLSQVGVNLSVQQLILDNSAEHLLGIVQKSGIRFQQLTLEITESVLIQSIEQASATLDKLRETGIRIALDDFGVGYSSLNYLSNLPVDVIKIDRSLTQQILTSPKQHALLHSIVEMAKINSLMVVAEGVETEEEQKMISASGVQYIQGFYYARPMQGEKFIGFLAGKKKEADSR